MKSVLIRLTQYKAQSSSAEKGVLNYILDKPNEAANCSIHHLASLAYTSPATIVRLSKKLGFDGYRDLQNNLLLELAMQEQAPLSLHGQLSGDASLSEIINGVSYRNIASLENSRLLVEEESVRQCVDILFRCDTILLFGIGASYLVAQDAYLKFLRVDKRCVLSEDIHSQYVHASNAHPNDAAIIISYSGHTEEMIRCATELKNKRIPIIAITRFVSSPVSQLADYNLYVVATEDVFRSGAMSSRISQLNMIDILYTAFVNCNYSSSLSRIKQNRIGKQGLT